MENKAIKIMLACHTCGNKTFIKREINGEEFYECLACGDFHYLKDLDIEEIK